MISRRTRELFYTMMVWPMRINARIHRHFRRHDGAAKVHLGPGLDKYIAGWINVDANFISAKIDVWADFRYALPFGDEKVDAFYSHHVIEHLPDARLPFHFAEMFRCLKPGGRIRVGGPDGESAARKLIEGDWSWFGDWPDKRTSVGGRYANFVLCRGEHTTILTYSYLEELLSGAGFINVARRAPTAETGHPAIFGPEVLSKEWEPSPECPRTVIVEAEKPIRG